MISPRSKVFLLTIFSLMTLISCFPTQEIDKRGIVLKCQGNPVSCYGKRAVEAALALKEAKRGIVLKCQGNPVSCYGKRSVEAFEALEEAKRGIVLKCQGNPVSCYGKRSVENDYESISVPDTEEEHEKFALGLINSCVLDSTDESCVAILRILLKNLD